MIVGTRPKRLLPGGITNVVFMVQNLDAAAKVYLHQLEAETEDRFEVAPVSVMSPFPWIGEDLWISASADGVRVAVLVTPAQFVAGSGRSGMAAQVTQQASLLFSVKR